jgi:hypothetical protein
MPSIESRSTKRTEDPAENGTRSIIPGGWSDRVHFGLLGSLQQLRGYGFDWLAQAQLAPRPGILTLTAVLLLGLCTLLACCNLPARIDPGDFDLPAGHSSSKLESVEAKTSESVPTPPEPGVPGPAEMPHVAVPLVQLPLTPVPAPQPVPPEHAAPATSSPGAPLPPPVEPPSLPEPPQFPSSGVVPVAVPATEVPSLLPDSHRGDTAMTNNLKLLSAQVILAWALAAQASLAGQFDGPPSSGTEPDRMTAVMNQLQDLTKSLNELVAELKKLPKNLSQVNDDLRGAVAQQQINDLKQQVGQLQKEISDLRTRTPPQTTASLYPPTSSGTGRLRLMNSYLVPVSIVVNDVSYPLTPGEVRVVEGMRAGPFTYEVLGAGFGSIQPRVSRSLTANETYTIRVEPLR